MAIETTHLELLAQDPDEIARRVAGHLDLLARTATGDELVYSPMGRHSYYRDLLAQETGRITSVGGNDRLRRHREQMDQVREEREARAWQRMRAGGLEYRVEPNRTDGYGGYFSAPLWLNELFATANRVGRVLGGLMPRFQLPAGVSSINVPVLNTGTAVQPAIDDAAVEKQNFTDSSATSSVVPLAGTADVALQLLEQSPPGAHLDWAIFMDLAEAYAASLELQLLTGGGTDALLGVTNVTGITAVSYTSASPTGSLMWTAMSKLAAQLGDARNRPPECWLMRTARWAYLQGSEDTGTRPFGLSTQFYLGNDDTTPDPVSGVMGWPVFLDDAIPATQGAAANQDQIVCLRPTDLILAEGEPQTVIAREPMSGTLGVRLMMHCNVAAITGRRAVGIGVLSGTGMVVQSGY
jgi:HK97 family phage major capsid protein